MYSSRKNPYPPHGRSLEIPGVVLKVKILEAKHEDKLQFPGGRGAGVQNKKPSMGEYGYFLEVHNWQYIKAGAKNMQYKLKLSKFGAFFLNSLAKKSNNYWCLSCCKPLNCVTGKLYSYKIFLFRFLCSVIGLENSYMYVNMSSSSPYY